MGLSVPSRSRGKTGVAGTPGPAGIGVTHTDVVNGNLLVTYTDGSTVNAGHVLGADGTAGATGRGIAATDVVNGHLIVTYSDGATATLGSIVGPQGETGATGRGVQSAVVTAGRLIVTLTDGTTVDAGAVQGPQGVAGQTGATGKGIQSSVVNGAGHLILTYTDATTADVGQVVGATGSTGATGSAGRGVTGSAITGGHLIITYTDSSTADLGQVVGSAGSTGATGAAGAAGSTPWAAVAAWQPLTNYTGAAPASVVTYDDGSGVQTYVAKSGLGAFTSGSSFNASNWTLIAARGASGAAYSGSPTIIGLKRIVVWSTDNSTLIASYRVLYPATGRTYTWSLVTPSVASALAITAGGDLSTTAAGFDTVAAEGTITATVRVTDDLGGILDQAITVVRRVAASAGANLATLRRLYVSSVEITASNASFNFAGAVPAGANEVEVECVGGGASGYCGGSLSGHGGEAGQVSRIVKRVADISSTVSATIGAGGAQITTAYTSNSGGTTAFGAYIQALGGIGTSFTALADLTPGAVTHASNPPVGRAGFVSGINSALIRNAEPSQGPGAGGAGATSWTYSSGQLPSGAGGNSGVHLPGSTAAGGASGINTDSGHAGANAPNVFGYGAGGSGGTIGYGTGGPGGLPGGGGGGGCGSTAGATGTVYGGGGGRGAIRLHFYRYEAP